MTERARCFKPPRDERHAGPGRGLLWATVGILGLVPACLNPAISDEPPISENAAALDVTRLETTDTPADAGVSDMEPSSDERAPPATTSEPDTRRGRQVRTRAPTRR